MKDLILTIDPGTRYCGVSVFHGSNLITMQVKNLFVKDSPRTRLQKVRKLFGNLFRAYAPDLLVIENPHDFWKNQSKYLEDLLKEIKHIARKNKIRVIEYPPGTIRKVICQNEQATNDDIVKAIGQSYPELKGYLFQSQKYKGEYWGHMLGSVALAICYVKCQKNTK